MPVTEHVDGEGKMVVCLDDHEGNQLVQAILLYLHKCTTYNIYKNNTGVIVE